MGVSRETLDRLVVYVDLLRDWQTRMNLVSNASLADVWRRHVLDSAQLIGHLPPKPSPLFDLGSGAGFPGLVLAILGIENVTLIESNQKKCTFLREAARVTGAQVAVVAERIEQFRPPRPARVITARALTQLENLLALATPLLARDGVMLLMKGARVHDELTVARKKWYIDIENIRSLSDDQATILKITRARSRMAKGR